MMVAAIWLRRIWPRTRLKKLNNVPDAITDLTFERLTDVSHKYMDTAIALFDRMGILESGIVSGGTKIKVLFPHNVGEIWFGTEDYNKAGTIIRDYGKKINIEKEVPTKAISDKTR